MINSYRIRLLLLGMVITGAFCLLTARLYYLQMVKYDYYVGKLPGTRPVYHRLAGTRGRILDRNGLELARNKYTLQVSLDLGAVVQHYKERHKNKVPEFEREPGKMEPDIIKMLEEVVFEPLGRYGLARPYNPTHIRRHYRTNRGEIPYTYAQDLTWKEFVQFAEQNNNLPGIVISRRAIRDYPFGALAGHELGYVRLFDNDIPEADKGQYKFYEGDDIGVAGLEESLNKYLKGKPGKRTLLVNEHGRLDREISYEPAMPGDDVYLTLDVRIQYIAEMALREAGVGRGSVVVMRPNTGEILAMASVPSYDPNRLTPNILEKDWKAFHDDQTVPLLNRSIQGFAPGSTFKILVALAGSLAPGKMSSHYYCGGTVLYGNRAFPCWTVQKGLPGHGSLDLQAGIMRSCNCFFYRYGNDAGILNIAKMGEMLGVGIATGVELSGEYPGLIPDPEWLKANPVGGVTKWSDARTANVSIGQGEVLASPLQMCGVTATVANGGKSYFPTLVHHRVNRAENVATAFTPRLRADLIKEGMKPSLLENIRKGMWKVVNEAGGTGKTFRSELPAIVEGGGGAGKTGTAQFKRRGIKDNHTWFICFAPYNKPEIAACILVQGGNTGGSCAAPVAKRVVERTLALESKSYHVDPNSIGRLAEAQGHFKYIEAVAYPGENIPEDSGDDVDSDESNARDSEVDVVKKVRAVPNEPDSPFKDPTFKQENVISIPKARPIEGPKYRINE